MSCSSTVLVKEGCRVTYKGSIFVQNPVTTGWEPFQTSNLWQMLLPMSFNSETQTISGIALVVIVGATAWTLSKKAAKLKDNNPETAKTSIVAAKTLPAESSLIASEAVNEANSSNCCLGHQHPAALLPENKGE